MSLRHGDALAVRELCGSLGDAAVGPVELDSLLPVKTQGLLVHITSLTASVQTKAGSAAERRETAECERGDLNQCRSLNA